MLSGGKSVKISVPPLAPHTVLLRGQERNAGSCTVKLTTEERPDLLYAALASAALFLGARHIANAKVRLRTCRA